MITTATEFAAQNAIPYPVAANTLKFLVIKGVVKEAGIRKRPDGKGKPSNLYDVPEGPCAINLTD